MDHGCLIIGRIDAGDLVITGAADRGVARIHDRPSRWMTKSLEVIGSPSDQKMHGLRFQVSVRPSAETPPFSALGISVGSVGNQVVLVVPLAGADTEHLPDPGGKAHIAERPN